MTKFGNEIKTAIFNEIPQQKQQDRLMWNADSLAEADRVSTAN